MVTHLPFVLLPACPNSLGHVLTHTVCILSGLKLSTAPMRPPDLHKVVGRGYATGVTPHVGTRPVNERLGAGHSNNTMTNVPGIAAVHVGQGNIL